MDSPAETICWECEATTNRPMVVSLAVPSRRTGSLLLCQSCYLTCYLSLIAEIPQDGAQGAPLLRNLGMTGSRHTSR